MTITFLMFKILQVWGKCFLEVSRLRLLYLLPEDGRRWLQNEADRRFDSLWDQMTEDEKKRLMKAKGEGHLWLLQTLEDKYLKD